MQWRPAGDIAESRAQPMNFGPVRSGRVHDEKALFTGECLVHEYLPNLDAGTAGDWKIWLESLRRVEALRPEFVVAGHGPVASDAAKGNHRLDYCAQKCHGPLSRLSVSLRCRSRYQHGESL